jgi:ATP-dependent RNA helicase HelY
VARVGSIDLPEPFRPRDTAYQRHVARTLRQWTPEGDAEPVRPLPSSGAAHPVALCPDLPEHRRWARRVAKLDRRLARTRRRLERPDRGLVDHFRSLLSLLEQWGYVAGWSLTERGERLRFVYNELDLVVTEAVERGELDGLRPADLAGLASLFTYEARAADAAGEWPSPLTAQRGERIIALAEDLAAAEERRGLPRTRPPDPGFAEVAFYWASGVELDDLFDDDFAAGDFVRNCRQLLDLLRQLRDVFPGLRSTAAAAIQLVDRGVVAAGGRL